MTDGKVRLDEWLNPGAGYFFASSRLLHVSQSPYQKIEIYETPFLGRLLRIDDCFMTTEKDEFFYHENLVHVPAIAHPNPKRALVIGGGDGGSSEEILKHPSIEKVVLCELDQVVVDVSKQYLQSVHRGVFDNPKLELRIGDGMRYLAETKEKFDLIVLDLTDPFGPSVALYTQEFYSDCKHALAPGGALSLHAESPITRPQLYARIINTLQSVFKIVRPYTLFIPIYGSWWGMACASDSLDPLAIEAKTVGERLTARGISDLQYYCPEVYPGLFALPRFQQTLLANAGPAIRKGETLIERYAASGP